MLFICQVIPESRIQPVDIIKCKAIAQSGKMFIDKLVLHPIKVRLSYIHTSLPRDKQVHILQLLYELLIISTVSVNIIEVTILLTTISQIFF